MSSSYRRNHVLSQCLLERFQNDNGNIMRYDLNYRKAKTTKPGLEGFHRGLWTGLSAKTMEALWSQQAENDIHVVFAKLAKRQRISRSDQELLARFCAMHFVRSNEFIKLYKKLAKSKYTTARMDSRLDFIDRYRVRLQLLKRLRIPSEHFESAVLEYYFKSVDYLKKIGIDIGFATGRNKFILPDGGFMIADVEKDRYQPTGGVALMDARQGIMPLGPSMLLAFNNKVKRIAYIDLDDEQVMNANKKLVRACHRHYYYKPRDMSTEPGVTDGYGHEL